jgi:hypothetical protein
MPYEYDSEGNATWTPDAGVDYAPEIDPYGTSAGNTYYPDYNNYDTSVYEIPNNASNESDPGWGWKYFSDGTVISPTNQYYTTDQDTGKTALVYDPGNFSNGIYGSLLSTLGNSAANSIKAMFTDKNGNVNWGSVAGAAGAILGGTGLLGGSAPQKTGYQGGIPELAAVREQVPETYDPERRAGSGGQKYFTDTAFVKPTEVDSATATAREQAAGIQALNKANPARENVAATQSTENLARGGIANIPTMKKGTYLAGKTDGMADRIPANIDGKQQARLSHGEFVIPADVVSHLGNGNSDAGADRLYAMMDKVRKARTGTKKQGKQINPNKYLMA